MPTSRVRGLEQTSEIAAPNSNGFEIAVGEQTIRCAAPVTGSYVQFQRVKLGEIKIASTGATSLAVRPLKDTWQPMNLKSIHLAPVTNH